MSVLVDTNILLRRLQPNHEHHAVAVDSATRLLLLASRFTVVAEPFEPSSAQASCSQRLQSFVEAFQRDRAVCFRTLRFDVD